MSRGIWARCLVAAIGAFLSAAQARAGDPAIADTNGLFGIELGYLQTGRDGGGQVINGMIGLDGQFHQCPGNDCSSPNTRFVSSTTTGGAGRRSGFAGFGGGEFAMPLGHDFGAQLDGELGGFQGGGGGDATLHLFRGDPAAGLFGPLINYTALADAGYLRAAAEVQFYWKDFTFYGNAGYQWADSGVNLNVDSGIVGCGYAAFYPMDSLMLLAGGGGGAGEFGGFGQIEWQPFEQRDPGATLFVEGIAGSDESAAAFAGFRYHFGAGNSLEMRHRHELPLRNTLCGFEQFRAAGPTTLNTFIIKRE